MQEVQMTLRQKQSLFAKLIAQLMTWACAQGYELTVGDFNAYDGHRAHSCHYLRLAADLNLFIGGSFLTKTEAHAPLGAYWKSLHPLCKWGGDFTKPDGNHYSLYHEGRA